jgi:hypothetical protein
MGSHEISAKLAKSAKNIGLLLTAIVLSSCGGHSGGGPTAPGVHASVQGSWEGVSVESKIQGPPCINPSGPTPIGATIIQNGPLIYMTIGDRHGTTCSFHGSVSDTTISWSADQPQYYASCKGLQSVRCQGSNGSVQYVDTRLRSADLGGSISGNHISVSGDVFSDVVDSSTGKLIDTLRVDAHIDLQRQGS